MLRLVDLTFRHPGSSTGYRFCAEAHRGEITAVSGPSGSGKSTLFDLIAGFLEPSGGEVWLDGTDLLPLAPEQRPVSILLQGEALFEHLSVAANLRLALPGLRRAEQDRRLGAALREVGLAGFENRMSATLSGGEQQRVALARTLLLNRPVLLLDEPFSALDDDMREAVRDLVRRLTIDRNWITILISHHADDAAALASRRYRLTEGRLEPA